MDLSTYFTGMGMLIAAGLIDAYPARAQTPINQCGTTITAPGRYIFTQDIDCGPGVGDVVGGLTINASGVTVDTRGYTLNVFGAALVINGSNVTIKGGGSIAGWVGAEIGKTNNVRLSNLTLTGSGSYASANAVVLDGARNVKVTNSTLSAGGQCGFGPLISGSVDNGVFIHNTFNVGCYFGAIGVTGSKILISNNTINQGHFTIGTMPVAVNVGSDTRVLRNIIALQGASGDISTETGIQITGSANLIKGNSIQGSPASKYGIHAVPGASDNTILRNSTSGSQEDIYESNGPPCVNRWEHNTFQTSSGAIACIK